MAGKIILDTLQDNLLKIEEELIINSSEKMQEWGEAFSKKIPSTINVIIFIGELGTGKTTLIKGLSKGLDINPEEVNSPSFTYLNIYETTQSLIYHFDLYRINDLKQFQAMGFEEKLSDNALCLIEWGELIFPIIDTSSTLVIKLHHQDMQTRKLQLFSFL